MIDRLQRPLCEPQVCDAENDSATPAEARRAMLLQYLKFFVNGGILGVVAWALQLAIFKALGGGSGAMYALATALTYMPLLIVNFRIQHVLIFRRSGVFPRFLLANLAVMLLVSLLSPLCRYPIALLAGDVWGDRGGFLVASILGSIPSFLIQRHWVFAARG